VNGELPVAEIEEFAQPLPGKITGLSGLVMLTLPRRIQNPQSPQPRKQLLRVPSDTA
jgi:hypothetical protein